MIHYNKDKNNTRWLASPKVLATIYSEWQRGIVAAILLFAALKDVKLDSRRLCTMKHLFLFRTRAASYHIALHTLTQATKPVSQRSRILVIWSWNSSITFNFLKLLYVLRAHRTQEIYITIGLKRKNNPRLEKKWNYISHPSRYYALQVQHCLLDFFNFAKSICWQLYGSSTIF